jgi:hypothetical protein
VHKTTDLNNFESESTGDSVSEKIQNLETDESVGASTRSGKKYSLSFGTKNRRKGISMKKIKLPKDLQGLEPDHVRGFIRGYENYVRNLGKDGGPLAIENFISDLLWFKLNRRNPEVFAKGNTISNFYRNW